MAKFSPDIFPDGILACFCGKGDDITNGVEHGGDLCTITNSTEDNDVIAYMQFLTWKYIAGGACVFDNADIGDYIQFLIVGPATVGTSNPGNGVYDKYAVGTGINMYVPNASYPSSAGDWDLNLTEKLNSNVDFTKVVPIPSPGNQGYFDWNEDTGAVTFDPTGSSSYNLFDFDVPMNQHVVDVPLLGSGQIDFKLANVKVLRLLPHWKMKITVHNETAKTLKTVWHLVLGVENG